MAVVLNETGFRARRRRMWDALPKDVDWVLIADPRHLNYLCGFSINPLSLSHGERGLLYLGRDGEAVLVCDNFALSSVIGSPFVDKTIAETWYDHRHGVPNRDQILFDGLMRIRSRLQRGAGFVETEWLPIAALDEIGVETAPQNRRLGTLLRSLRRRKEPDEIALLKRCMRAGEAGHRRGREIVVPGASEIEVYREVQSAAIGELGMQALVYGDFRATTKDNPRAGGPPTGYVMKEGDIFILDYSVVLADYRGDFTNSIAVGPETAAQQELMELCREALASGEHALAPGALARDVFEAVNSPLEKAGHPLTSHAGHGIGLGHPEAPAFVPESEEALETGEVVTLEPGVYLHGTGGIRIEHNYLITENGCERLTHHQIGL